MYMISRIQCRLDFQERQSNVANDKRWDFYNIDWLVLLQPVVLVLLDIDFLNKTLSYILYDTC